MTRERRERKAMINTILYIIIGVVGFFIIMNLIVVISGWLKKGRLLTNLSGELGRKIAAGQRMLIYFYSPSCAACRSMTPVIDKMRTENSNIQKINLAKDMNLGRQFGVMGTPATVLVEDARIQKFYLGARSEKFLRSLI
jgi:thioredoxin 1